MTPELVILAVPGLSLLAAVLIGLLGPKLLRQQSHWPAIAGVGGSLAAVVWLLFKALPDLGEGGAITGSLSPWFGSEGFTAWFAYLYDHLTAVMLLVVTVISTGVVVYSRGYMAGHRSFARFFAYICLFVFSMCVLVLGGNFLMLYVGWELVGLSSYLLIGFYYERPSARAAAKKAFIVNRVGDFGFALGIFLIWQTFGSLDYATVFSSLGTAGDGQLTAIALLLLCGAVGKSAQLPLHVWLPDAMEGPSPVSALIHAATMVTAGVYMVARSFALFQAAPYVLTVVAIIGASTGLFAATIAMVNMDLKRVLAYSTISQLGYMFLGLGVAAGASAIFHLFTHAFFKALLFLGAGAVMHALHDVLDLRRMGGLWRKLPITAVTFLAGCAALAGIPGTAGFFSKDQIIAGCYDAPHLGVLGPILGIVALVTAGLTAFYTFRLFARVFLGPEKLPEECHGSVHRPSPWMWIVLAALAVPSIAAGWPPVEHWIIETLGQVHVLGLDGEPLRTLTGPAGHPHWLPIVASVVSLASAGLALLLFWPMRSRVEAMGLDKTVGYRLLENKYWVDELYDYCIVRPARWVGWLCTKIDDHGIDNLLLGITWIPRGLGRGLRTAQRGSLGLYAVGFVAGAAVIVLALLLLT